MSTHLEVLKPHVLLLLAHFVDRVKLPQLLFRGPYVQMKLLLLEVMRAIDRQVLRDRGALPLRHHVKLGFH